MYSIFDIALDSDIQLPELSDIEIADYVITIKSGNTTQDIPDQPNWFHQLDDSAGKQWLSCSKLDDVYLLRFSGIADFTISQSYKSIQYYSEPGVTPETIRHLLLDQIIPRILGQQGRLVLHASAVVLPEGISVAFIGPSGRGKSTLASSFHENRATLITDDCLLLDEKDGKFIGIPNYFGVRLFDDSALAIFGQEFEKSPVAEYSSKSRLRLPKSNIGSHYMNSPLSVLFLLSDHAATDSDGEEIIISPISGAKELMSIIRQSFILDVTDKALIKKQFEIIGNLVKSDIKMFNLQYPRIHSYLPLVRSKINSVL